MDPRQSVPGQAGHAAQGDDDDSVEVDDNDCVDQVAEPAGGGDAVVQSYEDLKNKISESGAGGGSPAQTSEEQTQPF